MQNVVLTLTVLAFSWDTVLCQNTSNACTSISNDCDINADCMLSNSGYICTCKFGYSGNGTECKPMECLLSQAPKWPSSATRIIAYVNGTQIASSAHNDLVPYKTYIEYKCPDRFTLVNAKTSEPHTTVMECVGSGQPTHQNNGWTGSDVRCDMKVEFVIAIVAAAVSSVIIVLVGGAFIVSWSNKNKKKNEDSDTDTLEMNDSIGNIPGR